MFSFSRGFFDCLSGFGLIFRSGIKRYVITPLVINVCLFAGATKLAIDQFDIWIQRLLPDWLSWLEWIIWPLLAIVLILIMTYSFTMLANLIAAPFNSVLSSKVARTLTDEIPLEIHKESMSRTVYRSLISELRKILYAAKWFILLIIITLIPALNLISPFLWLWFAAWFLALEYNEYPLSNQGLHFPEVKKFNSQNRWRSLGFGIAVFLISSIPVLNLIAMPVAVAGATKLTLTSGTAMRP